MNEANNKSRRLFLGKALGAIAIAALNPVAIFLTPKEVLAYGESGFIIDLNSQKYSQLNAVNGSYWIKVPGAQREVLRDGSLFPYAFVVTRTSPSEFSAVLGWCTHQNSALIAYDGNVIACSTTDPGHGSTFDVNGKILSGPAHADLTQYTWTYHPANNTLEVFIPGLGVKDGTVVISSPELYQNFPNPVNTKTAIGFKILYYFNVRLWVTDALGHTIAILHDGSLAAGEYSFDFDASIFPSGTYFYHLNAGGEIQTKQMVVVR